MPDLETGVHKGRPLRPAMARRMSAVLEDAIRRYRIPGAIAGVWVRGDGCWTEARGRSSLKTTRFAGTGDRFRIASITKTFTATLVLQLEDEALLSLDDRLEKYIGSFPGAREITILELANHTSGLFDYMEDDLFLKSVLDDPVQEWNPQRLLDVATAHEPYGPPGFAYRYSNTNYVLLGMIIEETTGQKLAEVLEERISGPLGLTDTSLPGGPDILPPFLSGHRVAPDGNLVDATRFSPSIAWAAGGMISTLNDLERWARALALGELTSESAREEQLSWVYPPSGNSSAHQGMGFARYGIGVTGVGDYIGHEGELLGYNTALYTSPSSGATIVIAYNRYFGNVSAAGETFLALASLLDQ